MEVMRSSQETLLTIVEVMCIITKPISLPDRLCVSLGSHRFGDQCFIVRCRDNAGQQWGGHTCQ